MKIKKRTKKLTGGYLTLFLDIHPGNGLPRYKWYSKMKYKEKPKTHLERDMIKKVNAFVDEYSAKLLFESTRLENGLAEKWRTGEDFFSFANKYIEQQLHLSDLRMFRAALKQFKEYSNRSSLPCYTINETYLRGWVKELENKYHGETPHNYFKKIKRIISAACDERLFRENPARNIQVKRSVYRIKAVLSVEEINLLWKTPCSNNDVKRGFLFSSLTALRFCDIGALKWCHIKQSHLYIIQQKTKLPVQVPLGQKSIELLGERKNDNDFVFSLPTHNGCIKTLRSWTEKAGLNKQVTWHSARHSMATNLISSNVNVAVVSKILGHTNISTTSRYVRVSEQLKEEAINQFQKSIKSNLT